MCINIETWRHSNSWETPTFRSVERISNRINGRSLVSNSSWLLIFKLIHILIVANVMIYVWMLTWRSDSLHNESSAFKIKKRKKNFFLFSLKRTIGFSLEWHKLLLQVVNIWRGRTRILLVFSLFLSLWFLYFLWKNDKPVDPLQVSSPYDCSIRLFATISRSKWFRQLIWVYWRSVRRCWSFCC